MSDGYNSADDEEGASTSGIRKSGRKVVKKEVFELKDEPTIKRTKKFKVNPDGSPIVPGYPQTYHAVLAGAVATGAVSATSMEQALKQQQDSAAAGGAAGSATASAAGSAAAPGTVVNPNASKKRTSSKLYCFCQKPYDEATPMILCDDCKEWYHFACLGVTDDAGVAALEALASYSCPTCLSGGNKKGRKASGVGKKRKSKRNDDDDAASEEEADAARQQVNHLGQPIDPNDPTWINPYADLLADKAKSSQYSAAQLDQMRQYMHYNRAQYMMLQQQIQAQQTAAMMAQQQAAAAAAAAAAPATATAGGADAATAAAQPATAAAPAAEAAK